MTFLNLLGIQDALAAGAGQSSPESSLMSMLPMLVIFVLIFYFLLIRPQSKRAKEQRKLISELSNGDEVVTSGGMLGKIVKVSDDFLILSIADNTEIVIQKSAISTTIPKGTIKAV